MFFKMDDGDFTNVLDILNLLVSPDFLQVKSIIPCWLSRRAENTLNIELTHVLRSRIMNLNSMSK